MSLDLGGKIRKIDDYYEIEVKCMLCNEIHVLNNKNNEFEVKEENVAVFGYGLSDDVSSRRTKLIEVNGKVFCDNKNDYFDVRIQKEI